MIERAPRARTPAPHRVGAARTPRRDDGSSRVGCARYLGARPGVRVDCGCGVNDRAERGDGGICVLAPRLPLGMLSRSRAQRGKPTNDGSKISGGDGRICVFASHRDASGCFRDPERSEANPRTTVRKISGGDGRICPFASLRGATRPALDPGKALPLRSLVDGRDPAARNGSQGTDEWGFCRTRPWRPAGPLLAFGRIPCKGRGFQRCLAGRDP